jgi:hypothetical protein
MINYANQKPKWILPYQHWWPYPKVTGFNPVLSVENVFALIVAL